MSLDCLSTGSCLANHKLKFSQTQDMNNAKRTLQAAICPLRQQPLLILIAACIGLTAAADDSQRDKRAGQRLFTLQVLPLLESRCGGCHLKEQQGDFSIASLQDLLQGGQSGQPGIVPGDPSGGTVVNAIRRLDLEMPPKEADRFSEPEIALMTAWISAGAQWPDEATQQEIRAADATAQETAQGIKITTSGGLSEGWSNRRYKPQDVWAFRPLQPVHEHLPADLPQTAVIDHLIGLKLNHAQLPAAPRATPRELIRRATLDLHGLPPTPGEVAAFELASGKDATTAWEQLIDRLLDSPRYGEQWGRHWLDVTRYADTGGMSNDYERSNMWRYRDYVIRSFNSDKPWNDFIVEQLAGDELADHSVRSRSDGNMRTIHMHQQNGDYTEQESEWIIATGFLRMGPWDNAMVQPEEARQLWLDDVVNITGQAFLSQTMRCCRCHDHKFDPIPTRDYYRMYAAFSATQMAERPVPLLPQENRADFESGQAHVQRMLDYAQGRLAELMDKQETAAKEWYAERGLPYKNEKSRRSDPDETKPPRFVGLTAEEQGRRKVREQDEWIWNRRLERYQPFAQSVFNSSTSDQRYNAARKLRIQPKQRSSVLPETSILLGGSLLAPGESVSPGVLSAVPVSLTDSASDPWSISASLDGRRLDLARWIANPANVLTARSIANRIWQHHFERGLSATANNFGVKGAAPTHPLLLDWLANDFVTNGWTVKRMHRLIMHSAVYQRSSRSPNAAVLAKKDPSNQLLSVYPRKRLTAEQLRDSILMLTGELQQTTGGPPVMPEINQEVALQPRMIQFSIAPAWQPSRLPEQRNRRTIYTYHVRGLPDPFHSVFNQPDSSESCELRESAAVTPQTLTLFNSDQMTDRSLALAVRLMRESDTFAGQLQRAFELILLRSPSSVEMQQMQELQQQSEQYHSQVTPQPTVFPQSITRSLVEEFSGDVFTYTEILPAFENYVPDLKPDRAAANVRALADICLVLLNTNEFLFIE